MTPRLRRPDRASGVVAVGGGTSLLGLASIIPDHYLLLKGLLTYLAPAATVGFGFLWFFLITGLERRNAQRRLDLALRNAYQMRNKVLADPNSSESHKGSVQETVEKLERLAFNLITDEVEANRLTLRDVARRNGPA